MFALTDAASKRLFVLLIEASVNKTAQLAEPIVKLATADLIDLRVSDSSEFKVAIVCSTNCRPPSDPTTNADLICPSSIMLAACTMPVKIPRHALDTSKIKQSRGNPT